MGGFLTVGLIVVIIASIVNGIAMYIFVDISAFVIRVSN